MSAPSLINPPPASGGVPVGGSGTVGTLPIWVGASTLGNSAVTQVSGSIFSLTGLVGGTGYSQTPSFAFGGGSGSGATGAISQISGTTIVWVQLLDPGSGYVAGDVLTIPGGVGGTVTVLAVVPKNDASGHLTAQRIGAGTTQPEAGIDSRFAGLFNGFTRALQHSAIFTTGVGYDSGAKIVGVGSLNAAPINIDTQPANFLVGINCNPFVTTSIPNRSNSITAYAARPEQEVSAGSSFHQIIGYNATVFRSRATDTATNGSLTGYAAGIGWQNVGAWTQANVRGFAVSTFCNTGVTATVTDMTFFEVTSIGGSGRYVITNLNLFWSPPKTDAAGSTVTNFYAIRLQPVLMAITNRYQIAQEDVNGRSHLRAKVFVGSSVGAAQQTAASVEVGATNTILTGTITNAGAAYTDGTYNNQLFTGGAPTVQARGNFVVSGGVVTSVALISGGEGYAVGNVLSCALPGGAGFQWTVATVQGNGDVRLRSASAVFDASNSSTNGVRFFARTTGDLPTSTTQTWYEEGTYTPTGAGWQGTLAGSWTRIGRKVFVTISLSGSPNGNAAASTLTLPSGLAPARGGAGLRVKTATGTALGNGVCSVDNVTGLIQISTAVTVDNDPKTIQVEYEV